MAELQQQVTTSDLTVGIIGGMGPEATLDLLRRILAKTPAKDDSDHLRVLVDNNAKVPSRMAVLLGDGGDSPEPVLVAMAQGLVAQGADILAMPCNTAHYYFDAIQSATTAPLLNMPDLTVDCVAQTFDSAVLLGSSALSRTGLYEPYGQARGVQLRYPDDDDQSRLMALIKSVKAGSATDADIHWYRMLADKLLSSSAQCLIVACTELSVIDAQLSRDIARVDASEVLAEAIVSRAKRTHCAVS